MSHLARYYYETKKIKEYINLGGDSYNVRSKIAWAIFDRSYSSSEPIAMVEAVFYAELITKALNNNLQG